jgi:hypothetical protein
MNVRPYSSVYPSSKIIYFSGASGNNYTLLGDGSTLTYLNAPSGGSGALSVANAAKVTWTATAFASSIGFAISSNALTAWPSAPATAGAAYFGNSNGVVYLLTSGLGTSWTSTNKLAP